MHQLGVWIDKNSDLRDDCYDFWQWHHKSDTRKFHCQTPKPWKLVWVLPTFKRNSTTRMLTPRIKDFLLYAWSNGFRTHSKRKTKTSGCVSGQLKTMTGQ